MDTLLLDFDRASSTFELLFSFMRDEACTEDDIVNFEESLFEITQGAKLPEEAKEKIKLIHDRARSSRHSLEHIAERAIRELGDDRRSILALLSILLRLCVDDGIVCKEARERLSSFLDLFELSDEDVRQLSDESLSVLEFVYNQMPGVSKLAHSQLDIHYQTLGCSPASSSEELRTAYRKLVKKYHPDLKKKGQSVEEELLSKSQFHAIQDAFEAITRSRKL